MNSLRFRMLALLLTLLSFGACATPLSSRSLKACRPTDKELHWVWKRDKAAFERSLGDHFRAPRVLQVAAAYALPNDLFVFPAGVVYTQEEGFDTRSGRRNFYRTLVAKTQGAPSLLNALARADIAAAGNEGWVDASLEIQRYVQSFATGTQPTLEEFAALSQDLCLSDSQK
jgi:hypothetical protein